MKLLINIFTLVFLLTKSLISPCIITWPASIKEKIQQESAAKPCKNLTICRDYQEILDLAYCKSKKLATILPENYQLYYISTLYKAQGYNEWNKFLYLFENKAKNSRTFIRFCLPVSRRFNVWIDDRCPLDACEELGVIGECKENKEQQRTSFEILDKKSMDLIKRIVNKTEIST